ncbi:MAG: LPS export ABC transporter periplasmic protein LptC [Candidatus Zixiibacteriota bacterium]
MKYIEQMILFLLLIVAMIGCGKNDSNTNNLSSLEDSLLQPDTETSGAIISIYNKELLTAEILSEKIIEFETKDSTMAYMLNIDILDSSRHVTTEVIGDSGIIYESKGLLNIYGNVVVTTDDNSKLETDHLWWNSKTNRIKTDAFVRITKGEDIITGWGLDADNSLTHIKILNKVSGELSEPQKLESEK